VTSKSLYELAQLVHGKILGDGSIRIHGVADIGHAGPGEITFLANSKKLHLLQDSLAGAVIISNELTDITTPAILVQDPNFAFAVIHNALLAESFHPLGVSDRAFIGENCVIPPEVTIEPMCVLGKKVHLGKRVTIRAGTVIGDNVSIGDDATLYANVTVYSNCTIGKRVIIHSGAVIGADGFGYATDSQGVHVKRPHVGTVRLDDDVEIGANACVDRGTFGATHIKSGVKIDNLVQIAHNVEIGANSIIVGQVGIAGSATLGRNVVLGGQAAIAGHIHLGDGVMVGARSAVHNNQKPGNIVSGTPAIPHKKWLKASLAFEKIPDIIKEVRKLKNNLIQTKKNDEQTGE
jgi:UDP-3-O-[3-hydroxymyristoyl] glucosamine N-acyltransferase